jgi:Helicase conserved C-terminal domain
MRAFASSLIFSDPHMTTFLIFRFFTQHQDRIVRIVVDECHQVLTERGHRNQFDKIRKLAIYKVQKIYLTATLPPSLLKSFLRNVDLPPSTKVIRASTNRPNIRYHLLRVDESIKHATAVAVDVAKVLESQFTSGLARGIIFVDTVEDAITIGRSFDNCVCHSKMEGLERARNQSTWFNDYYFDRKWIVATSGFIHGIDHPRVEAVVACGTLYGLINLTQAFGRAGRLGQPVSVVGISNGLMQLVYDVHNNVEDHGGREAVTRWVGNTKRCRRETISQFLDGHLVSCDRLPNAEKCDICDPDAELLQLLRPLVSGSPEVVKYPLPSHPPANVPILHLHQSADPTSPNLVRLPAKGPSMAILLDASIVDSKMASKIDKAKILNNVYSRLYKKCVVCWVKTEKIVEQDKNHTPCSGSGEGGAPRSSGWTNFRKLIRFDGKYHYCFHCGMPQENFRPSRHPAFHKEQSIECPTNSFAYLVIWHIFNDAQIMVKAKKVFPALKDCSDVSQFVAWVVKEDAGNFYNGLELLIWFWKTRGLF